MSKQVWVQQEIKNEMNQVLNQVDGQRLKCKSKLQGFSPSKSHVGIKGVIERNTVE